MKNILSKIALSFALAAAVIACDKPYEIETPLALTQKKVTLKATLGSTPVIVHASGAWTVGFTETVSWASIDRVKGFGLGEVKFSYAANYGLSRSVGLVFTTDEKVDTVMMVQAAGQSEPTFHFNNPSYTLAKTPDTATIPFSANIPYNLKEVKATVTYADEENDEDWITDVKVFLDSVTFNVAQNFEGKDRTAILRLVHTDADGKALDTQVELVQGKLDPFLSFDAGITGGEVDFALNEVLVPVQSNLLPYLFRIVSSAKISYSGTQKDWIKKIEADASNGGVRVFMTQNNETAARKATVTMSYADENLSSKKTFTLNLTQGRFVKSWTFEEIKDLIQGESGSYKFNDYAVLDAVVVGDKDSKNMEFNPMDPNSNGGTRGMIQDYQDAFSFIENADATQGMRIMYKSKSDNSLARYSKVKFDLNGVTLTKEANPARYTLEGITMANITSVTPGIAAKRKAKTLAELTDDDVYTYVTLQDMEVTFKRGSYANVTDGYTFKADHNPMGSTLAFSDAYPLHLQDASGNVIYMVTNTLVPWRRTGSGVPQGSGEISGILVPGKNSVMARYVKDGDLGRYAIRVIEEGDLDMNTKRFSNVLVEWDWNTSTVAADILKPTTGEGKLFCNISEATGLTTDYNDLVSTGSGKGTINGACRWAANKWWGATADDAPYFQIEFSTKEVSGQNLVYNWSVAQGNGSNSTIFAPAYWHIEYSTDGTNFTKIEHEYAVRPIVWWANNCSLYAIPALSEYSVKLPSTLFGQDKVYVRFIASSQECATTTAPNGGTTSTMSSAYIRFGEMSVLYN